MSNELIVGVDVHRQQNVFSVLDGQGQELVASFACDNNRPGTQAAADRLAGFMAQGHFQQVRIGAEATGWYWRICQKGCVNGLTSEKERSPL
jgi:hypothetical protein